MNDRTIDGLLWGTGAVLLAGVLFFSFGPNARTTLTWAPPGWVLHTTGYATVLICFLLAGVWRPGRGPGPLAEKQILITVVAFVFSGVVELLQALVERDSQLTDLGTNALGAAIGLSFFELLRRTMKP